MDTLVSPILSLSHRPHWLVLCYPHSHLGGCKIEYFTSDSVAKKAKVKGNCVLILSNKLAAILDLESMVMKKKKRILRSREIKHQIRTQVLGSGRSGI